MGLCFRHQLLEPALKKKDLRQYFSNLKDDGSKFFPKAYKKPFKLMNPKFNTLHSDIRTLKLIIDNRIHLGHKVQKWNPKMKPFLRRRFLKHFVGKKGPAKAHVLDPLKTVSHLNYLSVTLSKSISSGKKMLFVGTKSQYKRLISKAANLCTSYFITEKWLGGMLTNWRTVRTLTVLLRKYDLMFQQGIIQGMYKKEAAKAYKEQNKLHRLLEGVKYMIRKPDLVVVMGQLSETTALDECKKIHIPSLCLVDSNCSPRISNFVLPTNDDSTRALNPLFEMVINSVKRGRLLTLNKNKPKPYRRIYPGKPPIKRKPKFSGRKKRKNFKQPEKPIKKFFQSDNIASKDEENKFLKLSTNKTVKSVESVEKGSSVLVNGFPECSKITNLNVLSENLSVLPKQLPKKKIYLQGLLNSESKDFKNDSSDEQCKEKKACNESQVLD